MIEKKNPYIAILGPTASGKSDLALQLAKRFNGEIICCDSVQMYKHLNIGSAKPSLEERKAVPHHLFDFLELDETYDASQYAHKAREVISEVSSRNKLAIVVGGTGFYYRFLIGDKFHNFPSDARLRKELGQKTNTELMFFLKKFDPERAQKIHINDMYRLIRAVELYELTGKTFKENTSKNSTNSFVPFCTIMVSQKRNILHDRIKARVQNMLSKGLIKEVSTLLKMGYSNSLKPLQSIGYKETFDFFLDKYNKEELEFKIICATRKYAKRQETWNKKIAADFQVDENTNFEELCKAIKQSNINKLF